MVIVVKNDKYSYIDKCKTCWQKNGSLLSLLADNTKKHIIKLLNQNIEKIEVDIEFKMLILTR